jgi:hypothetical protein
MKKIANVDIFNDVTRQHIPTSRDILPFNNNSRFEVDTLVNGKTHFQETNTVIQSLQEEIINLKDKLKLVYEKDKEIQELKCKLESLEKKDKENNISITQVNLLKEENKDFRDQLDMFRVKEMNIESLEAENHMLKEKLVELYERLHPNSDDEDSDDSESYINKINTSKKKSNEPMMSINVNDLKKILSKRLETYHNKHINDLINSYNLHEKSEISKSDMKSLLNEAIHM